jgi:drug/metabolite transporter (DMT)-like permease
MLVFGLVPFLTVFVMAQRVGGDLRLLVPAVVGVGGLALVVPFAWPSSNVGVGWLVGMAIAAGFVAVAGIRMHGLMRGASTVWAGALGSGAAALLAGAAWWVMERGPVDFGWRVVAMEVGWSLVVDLPLVLLTIWLVREMRPVGFAARFLSVPLVTILGGLGVMRPVVVWTTWLGLALVAGGCWVLLRNQADVEVTGPLR